MKLEGEYLFNGPREAVWTIVRDPDVLATCLPGTQKLTRVNDNEYEGVINVRIGPVSGVFSGKLVISDEVPPESCTLSVEGRGAPGFAKGVGNVHLLERAGPQTLLSYDGELQIGGKLASVGQRLLDSVSKSMIRQGLESLEKALEARMGAEEGKEVEFKAPTEADMAKEVVKDVAGGVTSIAEVRMLMYVVPMAILFALFAFFISRCGG